MCRLLLHNVLLFLLLTLGVPGRIKKTAVFTSTTTKKHFLNSSLFYFLSILLNNTNKLMVLMFTVFCG